MGHLLDALDHACRVLGFEDAAGGDEVFRDLVLARIIEPASKLDSGRVLEEAGAAPASYPTVNRRLPVCAKNAWRERLSAACAAHARLGAHPSAFWTGSDSGLSVAGNSASAMVLEASTVLSNWRSLIARGEVLPPCLSDPVRLEYTIVVMTCKYSWVSGGDLVLAGEAAEDLFSADAVIFEVDLRWLGTGLSWWELVECAMRPGGVVVRQVLGQYLSQMVLVDDQQPIEDLAAQGADHPLADGICSGRLRRAAENALARAWNSPDLIPSDRLRVATLVRREIDAARDLHAVPGADRSLELIAQQELPSLDDPELRDTFASCDSSPGSNKPHVAHGVHPGSRSKECSGR